MTPEERAVLLCPDYEGHAHGNVDAMGKCCEQCESIADAIRAAVAEKRETFAHLLFAVNALLVEDATPHRGEIRYAQAISPQIDRVRKEYEAIRARG